MKLYQRRRRSKAARASKPRSIILKDASLTAPPLLAFIQRSHCLRLCYLYRAAQSFGLSISSWRSNVPLLSLHNEAGT